jgi:hypothetical protein
VSRASTTGFEDFGYHSATKPHQPEIGSSIPTGFENLNDQFEVFDEFSIRKRNYTFYQNPVPEAPEGPGLGY